MANEKITQLDAHGAFDDADLIEVIDDPAGTPDNEKATVGALLNYSAGRSVRQVAYASVAAASAAGLLTLITDGAVLARDSGTGQAYYGPLWPVTPLDQSGWTWINQGSATVTQAGGLVYLLSPGTAGTNVRGRYTTAPTAPYTITAAILPALPGGGHGHIGIGFREASTGKIYDVHIWNNGGGSAESIRVVKWTNATTVSGTVATRSTCGYRSPVWLRIADNNTNVIFSVSPDGYNWMAVFTEARGSFMAGGSGPTQVGFFLECQDTTTVGGIAGTYVSWVQA